MSIPSSEESAPLLGDNGAKDVADAKSANSLRHMFGIFASATCNGIEVMMIFTIAVYVVRGFGVDDEVKVGRMTGLLTCLYQLGQFCTSYMWGRISDCVGRKPVVVFSNAYSIFSVLLLGMVNNYPAACLARFMGGVLNGIPGTLRTMAGETGTGGDQASVLLLMTMGWGLGTTLGPTIGAMFSNPCETYGSEFPLCGHGDLLDRRKYLLPCLVAMLVNSVGAIASLFVNETLSRSASSLETINPASCASAIPAVQRQREQDQGRAAEEAAPEAPILGYVNSLDPEAQHDQEERWWRLQSVRAAVAGFAAVALVNAMWDEIIPIYASSPVGKGGLSFKTSELGLPLTIGGISLFAFAILGYKRLQSYFGVARLTRYGLYAYAPLAMAFPLISALIPYHKPAAIAMLVLALVLKSTISTSVSTSAAMMTNASSPPTQLGEVNGFGMTMVALMRALGPAMGGLVWSTTLALKIPLHQYITYAVVGAAGMATSCFYAKRKNQ